VDGATETDTAVRTGNLWKYNPHPNVYRCPSSFDRSHFRTYSISTYLGGSKAWASAAFVPGGTILTKLSQVKPGTLVMLEEYDTQKDGVTGQTATSNLGSFLFCATFDQNNGLYYQWADAPGIFHGKGTNMAFGDGHCEYHIWGDSRTLKAVHNQQQINNQDVVGLRYLLFGPWK
jgi:prepilin-type processing-associated H-X9-DG protein